MTLLKEKLCDILLKRIETAEELANYLVEKNLSVDDLGVFLESRFVIAGIKMSEVREILEKKRKVTDGNV